MKNLKRKALILVESISLLEMHQAMFKSMKNDPDIDFTENELKDKSTEILMLEVSIQQLLTDIKKIEL